MIVTLDILFVHYMTNYNRTPLDTGKDSCQGRPLNILPGQSAILLTSTKWSGMAWPYFFIHEVLVAVLMPSSRVAWLRVPTSAWIQIK